MENAMFSFDELNCFGFQDEFISTNVVSESTDGGDKGTNGPSYGAQEWRESAGIDSLCSDYGFYKENLWEQELLISSYEEQERLQQSFLDCEQFDDFKFNILSPPLETCLEEITKLGEIQKGIQEVEPKEDKSYPISSESLQLLRSYNKGFKQLSSGRVIVPINCTPSTIAAGQGLSTEEIIRIAGARFIQSSCQGVEVASIFNNPFYLSSSGLSDEDAKMVKLAESLLASAEKIGNQQFDCASRLLKQCNSFSSNEGNPVQRVAYYFAEVLQERIDIEIGRITSKEQWKKQSFDIDKAMTTPNPTALASHQAIPFCQILHFAGIQAILDNVDDASRIHIIDFTLRCGLQWTVLMQALVSRCECPVELLKITAIATAWEDLIETTGKRLTAFAQTMNLAFSFKIVVVSDVLELKEDLLEIDDEEIVAIYSDNLPRSLIALPKRLESIMRMIKNIIPCVMVVAEIESNQNSPTFLNRFIEALFFFSAYFDCLDACMERDDSNRLILEAMYLGKGIRNAIAIEGEEKTIRSRKLDAWRSFYARFGMVEIDLSSSSLLQANLIVKKFACGNYCTLNKNGKSLIIGWKGTPLHSLSAWKFILEE
ncbi:hypothetical protein P3X46_028212 [Hevea brasiliensis]|uniref:Uncharacterized protein n=1 Tax=Hevea brasiliensis TaxID=3981 RepID=A0ABQ9KP55_HEVBR|nr:DELLA protein RGL1-like [Hevea brasiliensis]KAJ9145884.1 hypothetical protein P3X46_028212 [Hevea brasiliensis]